MVFFLGKLDYSSVQGASYTQTFCLTYNSRSHRLSPWPSNLNRRTRNSDENEGRKKRWWQFWKRQHDNGPRIA